YRDIPASEIPRVLLPQGGEAKVVAGMLTQDGSTTHGPINGRGAKLSTDPLSLDVRLPAGAEFKHQVASGHSAFLYVYEGSAKIGAAGPVKPLHRGAAGGLSGGDNGGG